MEYARNVAGIPDAHHAEYDPPNGTLIITPVACPVPDRAKGATALSGKLRMTLTPGSLIHRVVGTPAIEEAYTCNYELNPDFRDVLVTAGLRVGAADAGGTVRAVELSDRRFFVATLFQPQLSSLAERPHPLIAAYLRAAMEK